MFAHAPVARNDWNAGHAVHGRSVKAALLTWPVIVCLGATVAAAACWIGDCDKHADNPAKERRVGHTGTVKTVTFSADGSLLSSVGIDGSIVIWGPARCIEHPFLPDGPG